MAVRDGCCQHEHPVWKKKKKKTCLLGGKCHSLLFFKKIRKRQGKLRRGNALKKTLTLFTIVLPYPNKHKLRNQLRNVRKTKEKVHLSFSFTSSSPLHLTGVGPSEQRLLLKAIYAVKMS